MRSNVASHSNACSAVRSTCGGRRKPDAFMTRRTFLSDSGTASNCNREPRQSASASSEKKEVEPRNAPSGPVSHCA